MIKKLLNQYTKLSIEIEDEKKRLGIKAKERELEKVTDKIKEIARQLDEREINKAKNDFHYLRVDRPYKKEYNWEVIQRYATEEEKEIIEKKALKTEIIFNKFNQLVEEGLVSRELRTKRGAFKEKALTPRVVIVPIKEK